MKKVPNDTRAAIAYIVILAAIMLFICYGSGCAIIRIGYPPDKKPTIHIEKNVNKKDSTP